MADVTSAKNAVAVGDLQLTKHFKWSEFWCKSGSVMSADLFPNILTLAIQLETLRRYYGKPVTVLSGFRDPVYNRNVGGSPNSQHLQGKAADIRIYGHSPKEVADAIELLIATGKMRQGGIGIYKTFTHYDFRGTRARWSEL